MNNVLAFDLDGTLIDSKNEIIGGAKTLQVLKFLQQKGFQLVINTGRLDHDIYYINLMYDMQIDYRISQNGAVVQNKERSIAKLLDKQQALQLYEHLHGTPLRVELNTVSNRYWHTDRDPQFPREYYDSSKICKDFMEIIMFQPIVLFLIIGEFDEIDKMQTYIQTHYDKMDAVKTSDTSLEVLQKGVSKGKTIRELWPEANIISIGDSENDFSMFESSNSSYYVGNRICPNGVQSCRTILEALHQIVESLNR